MLFRCPLLHRISKLISFVCIFLIVSDGVEGEGDLVCDASNGEKECLAAIKTIENSCTVFLTESSIPGAGLGIFTTVERQVNDIVGKGEVNLPIFDHDYHLSALGFEWSDFPGNPNIAYDYIWWAPDLGLHTEAQNPYHGNYFFAPGLDAAINCHMALLNTDKVGTRYEPLDLHRGRDPGVGAYTPYHNSSTIVTQYIPAGGELFKFYGDHYFSDRPHLYPDMPLSGDYPAAETLTKQFDTMMMKHLNLPEEVITDAWKLMTEFPVRSRLLNAIPKDAAVAKILAKDGTRAAWQPFATKNIDDIIHHGRCLESIDAKPSTIRQAARGAFAAFFFPKDSVITGSPLIFFPTLDSFRMYEGDWYSHINKPNQEEIHGYQITLNYCFHHPNSSIYLLPYGSGVNYINHNKTRANVKLRWSRNGEMGYDNDRVLAKDPETLKYSVAPGLFLDYVASRDIQEGEELFLDYGDAWEEAWLKHEQNWNKYEQYNDDYKTGDDWNEMLANSGDNFLRTVEEQEVYPYPENLAMHCFNPHNLPNTDMQRIIDLIVDYLASYPCKIIDRYKNEQGEFVYTVAYKAPDIARWLIQEHVPREAIKFVNAPYSSDLFLPDAFRHPIILPDELFPDAWKGKFLSLP